MSDNLSDSVSGLQGVAQKLTVSWADPERRMLKRKFQDGNAGPNPNFQRSMLNVAPGEEREVRSAYRSPLSANGASLIRQ
jgi:hypothetical protein